jgi:hypothetical protein
MTVLKETWQNTSTAPSLGFVSSHQLSYILLAEETYQVDQEQISHVIIKEFKGYVRITITAIKQLQKKCEGGREPMQRY